jgi:hypothetical protein
MLRSRLPARERLARNARTPRKLLLSKARSSKCSDKLG